MRSMAALVVALSFTTITVVEAAPLEPGNLLIARSTTISEITLAGEVVQQFELQHPDGALPSNYRVRDIVVDDTGTVHVFAGTFEPFVSSFNPGLDFLSWQHQTFPDFSIVNNVSYGGIATFGSRVFAVDQSTASQPPEEGVIVFDGSLFGGGEPFRGVGDVDAIDLNIGPDGLLYVLERSGTDGSEIAVFDPDSFERLETIDLRATLGNSGHRSIAVGLDGAVYVADWDGEIHGFVERPTGGGLAIVTTTPDLCSSFGRPTTCRFVDIDVTQSGDLVASTWTGEVILIDSALESARLVSQDPVFSADALFVAVVPGEPVDDEPLYAALDVITNSTANRVNPNTLRLMVVGVLTDDVVDASDIDPSTITFGPGGALPLRRPRYRDIDGDGDLDLRLIFGVVDSGVQCGDTELSLYATLIDGQEIIGTDFIQTFGCE